MNLNINCNVEDCRRDVIIYFTINVIVLKFRMLWNRRMLCRKLSSKIIDSGKENLPKGFFILLYLYHQVTSAWFSNYNFATLSRRWGVFCQCNTDYNFELSTLDSYIQHILNNLLFSDISVYHNPYRKCCSKTFAILLAYFLMVHSDHVSPLFKWKVRISMTDGFSSTSITELRTNLNW